MSQGAISSYETGTRKSTTGLVQLAQALGVSPTWLITGTGPMEIDREIAPSLASDKKLQDIQQESIPATWPFKSIRPGEYWALPAAQRRIVEQTVAAMIVALRQEGDKA